jgi:hypothetical protein
LKSQFGEFEVLPEKHQIGEISISLIGHPAEGGIRSRIKAKEQEGYISVDWKRQGDGLVVTGVDK